MTEKTTRLLMEMRLDMGPAQQVTGQSGETRLIYHVRGGRFEGKQIAGKILPVSGDWVSIKNNVITMDVRVQLQTDEGWLVQMSYESISDLSEEERRVFAARGKIDQAGHFFRVVPTFTTRAPQLEWLTRASIFGVGTRYEDRIEYDVFEEIARQPCDKGAPQHAD
ncbi:DUF3237 domain-containing protein [Pseudooceanicola nitratireducens]|jgi:hypothetical protein|uniref:DUF3237 domain-containing protein n=1 Tax=Pseudooceanicola nitratireducens TaxID=517719 RepID=UPI001C95232D|nr:DUF3237 domain-containing protein [Pseudooceanicola nitratireducens]MBY6158362.1 DUF3237 domain-containing protein [Pseudooceanicola nitratireducens]MEC7298657.1 DUF3237 domain-containing protein [Pseudomonadota bacterium]